MGGRIVVMVDGSSTAGSGMAMPISSPVVTTGNLLYLATGGDRLPRLEELT